MKTKKFNLNQLLGNEVKAQETANAAKKAASVSLSISYWAKNLTPYEVKKEDKDENL